MALEDYSLKNLNSAEAISKATSSINPYAKPVETSIFENLTEEKFTEMVDKKAAADNAESVFFQSIKNVGSEDVFSAIDKNGDGVIQEDEIAELAGLDKDDSNLSTFDIIDILHDILNKAINTLKIENPQINDAVNAMLPSGGDYYSMPASGGYSAPAGSSYNQVYGNSGASNNQFSGFSLDELKSEKSSIESNISTLESAVTEAEGAVTQAEEKLTDAEEKLTEAEAKMETAEKLMDDAISKDPLVDAEKKQALEDLDGKIDDKDGEITSNEEAVTAKENEISTADNNIQETRNSISEKDQSISSIESNISELSSQLSSVDEGATDSEKSAAKDKKASIREQISEAKTKLANEQKAREELEAKRDEYIQQKETLTGELKELKTKNQKLQEEKNDLLDQKSNITLDVLKDGCNPITMTAITAFNQSKENYQTAQENKLTAETELDSAKETLDSKKTELDKEKDNLNKVDNMICQKENNGSAEDFIATAMKYIGKNESDGSYHLFTNGRDEAWCADFVSYVAKEFYGDDLPAGFGSPSVSTLYQWGKDNGRTVGFEGVKPGDVMIQKSNGASHTGIVTAVDADGTIHTIEGNTSDQVAERTYKPGSSGYNKITDFINIEP